MNKDKTMISEQMLTWGSHFRDGAYPPPPSLLMPITVECCRRCRRAMRFGSSSFNFYSSPSYVIHPCVVALRYVAVSSLVVFDYSASAVATTITITARVFVGYQCYVTMLICVSFNTVACCALYVLLMLDRFPSDRTPQWRLTTRTSWQVFGSDSSDVQQTSLERFADDDGLARLTTCNSYTIIIITGTVSINWQYWPFTITKLFCADFVFILKILINVHILCKEISRFFPVSVYLILLISYSYCDP